MKNTKKIAIALTTMMILAGCHTTQEEPVTGGWTEVKDGTVTEDLQKIFDRAMEKKIGVTYTAKELLETQIVSGTNYKFLCESTATVPNAETKQVIVTIYEDLNGNVEVTDIEELQQIANPFITVDTIEEAEDGAGFAIVLPEIDYEITDITYIDNNMIQVIYDNDSISAKQ